MLHMNYNRSWFIGDLEKKANDSHNTCYQNAIHYAFARLKECPSTQQHIFLDESIDAIHLIANDNSYG